MTAGIVYKDPKDDILKFIKEHKEELLLNNTAVVRLVGFHEDDQDYYYAILSLMSGFSYLSCVGSLIPLKGVLPEKEYNQIDHFFNLNIGHAIYNQKKKAPSTGIDLDSYLIKDPKSMG